MSLSSVKRIAVLAVTLGALLFCFPAFSQLNLGRIFGGVTDQTGGAIVGATVTVVDVARGVSRPLISDSAGEYSAPSLTPGLYTVRAEAKGFQTLERTDITVGVGQDVRVDLMLQPGAQTQTITVTGELPVVNAANAQLGGTLETTTVTETPLNGREYMSLINYAPGIFEAPGGNGSSGANAFSSNGNRAQTNVWLLDGINDTNRFSSNGPYVGGAEPGVDQATILPLDAIQEMNVIENPGAEFGYKTGAQVNIGLKSGTNTLHGSAFGLLRNNALDAKNPYLKPTQSKEADNLKQYGASIGGPIKKDKIFFFGAYEGQNVDIGQPSILTVPTTATGTGLTASNSFPAAIAAMEAAPLNYCNPAAAGCAKPISQLSLNLAGCTLPAGLTGAATCNAANGVFGNSSSSSQEPGGQPYTGSSNNGIMKIDYHLSDKNAFNAEYFFGQSLFLSGGAVVQNYFRAGNYDRTQAFRAVEIWTPNSNWVNEMRFGIDRLNYPEFSAEATGPTFQPPGVISGPNYATQYGLVTGATSPGFPVLAINGFTSLGAGGTFQTSVTTTLAGVDTVSYTHGKHLFKFGVNIDGDLFTGTGGAANGILKGDLVFNGIGTVNPLEAFLAGTPTLGSSTGTRISTSLASLTAAINWHQYALYAQDDWRLTPRVTLNLGLRWEKQSPLTATNNVLGNFNASAPSGLVQAGVNGQGAELYHTDNRDFGPRVGLAWDMFGNGRTVLHLGGGIAYETLGAIQFTGAQGAALNAIPTGFNLIQANGAKVTPQPGTIAGGVILPSSVNWGVGTPIFNVGAGATPSCGDGLGSVNPLAATGTANPAYPGPCVIDVINPNFKNGYVSTWTLGIQHALTNNLSLNVGYVGTHGTNLASVLNLNQPLVGVSNTEAGYAVEQTRSPYFSQFPYLGTIGQESNAAESNYNALQVGLTQRVSHGLSLLLGYTWAHTFSEDDNDTGIGFTDALNPHLDYGPSAFDIRNRVTLAGTYLIPGIKTPGQILEGWQVNSAIIAESGAPFNATDAADDLTGTGVSDRWDVSGPAKAFTVGLGPLPCFAVPGSTFATAAGAPCVTVAAGTGTIGSASFVTNMPPGCIAIAASEPTNPNVPVGTTAYNGYAALGHFGCYAENGSYIVPEAQGTFGDMQKNDMLGKPFYEWDFGAAKNWKFSERYSLQFKAEFFNLLNRTSYGAPGGAVNTPGTFGVVVSTVNTVPVIGSGAPREIQLNLKFSF